MKTQDKIEQFIVQELLSAGTRTAIGPDEPLISSGAVDSLGMLRLMTFIEEQLGITITDGEVVSDNFETLRKISSFVDHKIAESVKPAPQDE